MKAQRWTVGAYGLLLAAGLVSGCSPEINTDAANAPGGSHPAPAMPSVGGSSHSAAGHSANSPSMQRLHAATGAEFERGFLTAMIEHHQGAADMSRMAHKHLKRKEVREAAEKIIADQEKEIDQMHTWLREWSGGGSEPEMAQMAKAEMDAMMTAFTRDCQSDCDRAYLTHMISHHRGTVDMAPMAQQKAIHPELKQLAGQMLEMQRKEIAQFQSWLAGS